MVIIAFLIFLPLSYNKKAAMVCFHFCICNPQISSAQRFPDRMNEARKKRKKSTASRIEKFQKILHKVKLGFLEE